MLQIYDLLPSNYIRAALGLTGYAEDLLTVLVKGHYIGLADEAKRRMNARGRPYIYHLLPRGKRLLEDRGMWKGAYRPSDAYDHKLLRCILQFSFDRAPKEVPGLRLVTPAEILNHRYCPQTTREAKYPWRIDLKPPFEPDAPVFGYELNGNFLFLNGFEADRNTESLTIIRAKLRRYAQYLTLKQYRVLYGLRSKPRILFITTNETHLENCLTVVKEEFPELANDVFFKCVSEQYLPPPTAHMVTEPWRTANGMWSILDTLKGDRRDTRGENRPHQRAG